MAAITRYKQIGRKGILDDIPALFVRLATEG